MPSQEIWESEWEEQVAYTWRNRDTNTERELEDSKVKRKETVPDRSKCKRDGSD